MGPVPVTVGIDVAKATLVIAVRPTGECWETPNDPRALSRLARRLRALGPARIIVEATGRYHVPVHRALAEADLPVAVVNPRQTRAFAKTLNRLAKTDSIDAHVLAHYGAVIPVRLTPAPDAATVALHDLVVRRRQLIEMRTAESNRLDGASDAIRRLIRAQLRSFARQLALVERELAQILQAPRFRDRVAILQSVPGIGAQSAATLVTELPELGELSHKRLAALVGVAPLNRDSGSFRGRRTTWGGRRTVRSALYMPTLAAIRFNHDIRTFYQRLVANGRPKQLAVIACQHKLLTILYALTKQHRLWEATYVPAA
jgi:transposase